MNILFFLIQAEAVTDLLPSKDDLLAANPDNPSQAYGLLVLFLGILVIGFAIMYILEKRSKTKSEVAIRDAHQKEVEGLRQENKETVDKMLAINKESIPMFSKIMQVMSDNNTLSQDLKREIEALKERAEKLSADHVEIKSNIKSLK